VAQKGRIRSLRFLVQKETTAKGGGKDIDMRGKTYADREGKGGAKSLPRAPRYVAFVRGGIKRPCANS